MGSGVCDLAPRCLSTGNAGRTMAGIAPHALCGDDFHQTPVSIIFSGKCLKLVSGFVGDATQVMMTVHSSPVSSPPAEKHPNAHPVGPFAQYLRDMLCVVFSHVRCGFCDKFKNRKTSGSKQLCFCRDAKRTIVRNAYTGPKHT